jgi:DNA-binding MarR family transcriptional regulator
MTDKPHESGAQAVVELSRKLLGELAEKYGGDCTLNELRVINQVVSCSVSGRTCCVTDLHKVTGIPVPTVSRAVANLQNDGWLSDQPDPTDGRKRIISLGPRSLKRTPGEVDRWVKRIDEFH